MMKTKITNVTVYNGLGGVFKNQTLLFDENEILFCGNGPIDKEADIVIDGKGLSCLPGMIDMHVHLNLDGAPDISKTISEDNEAFAAFRSLVNAQKQLNAGVTTVRNCGSKYNVDISLRNAISQGILEGPTVYAAGQPIVMTGGHCHFFSLEADGIDEIRKAARTQIKAGADVLKMMATGGGLTKGVKPGAPQLSEDEMQAACCEANNAGKTTAAHAQGNEGIKNAIRAGVTTIEHGVELDDEAIQLMLEHNTYLVATLSAPQNVIKYGEEAGIPKYAVDKNREALIPHRESFKKAYKAGVKIAVGTDAGTPFNFHGDYVTELEIMSQLGMSTQEVIQSATYMGAAALGVQEVIGSVEKGKKADLLLVYGEPEENISTLRNIHSVYVNGKCMVDNAETSRVPSNSY